MENCRSFHSDRESMENDELVTVFLTCVFCGSVRESCIPASPELGKKVYWECFECQKRDDNNVRGFPRRVHSGT